MADEELGPIECECGALEPTLHQIDCRRHEASTCAQCGHDDAFREMGAMAARRLGIAEAYIARRARILGRHLSEAEASDLHAIVARAAMEFPDLAHTEPTAPRLDGLEYRQRSGPP